MWLHAERLSQNVLRKTKMFFNYTAALSWIMKLNNDLMFYQYIIKFIRKSGHYSNAYFYESIPLYVFLQKKDFNICVYAQRLN